MTREEALPKDEALLEIIAAVRNLPELRIVFGNNSSLVPETVVKYKVIGIIQMYLR